jgi:hypothetical protein
LELQPFYVLGRYEKDKFKEYVRESENGDILGYRTLESAQKGQSHFLFANQENGIDLKVLQVKLRIG